MFVNAVVAALVAFPFAAQTAVATTCARTYTVQEGDWCDTISAAKNVSTYQLAVVNIDTIDKSCSNLQPGQQICLGYQGEDCTTTHVVKAGDSCGAIADTYRINSTMLAHNNPQLTAECDNLYIGEVVCVGGDPAVPTLPEGAPVPAATIPPGATPAQPTTSSAAPSATATPTDDDDEDCEDEEDGDDEEDEDEIPYCDEL